MYRYVKYFVLFALSCSLSFLYFKENVHPTRPSYTSLYSGQNKFVAFVRVKNEIKTLEACLDSIDGVFHRIVLIHSNEPDDGSIEFMNKWCQKRPYCEIHEYPHAVLPSNDPRYQHNPPYQNTLAAYYNFGLSFFEPEDWVVKIDADQIYITGTLVQALQKIDKKAQNADHYLLGITGINSLVWKGRLVNDKKAPINGLEFDSFIVKRKYIKTFTQGPYWERLRFVDTPDLTKGVFPRMVFWFHFSDQIKKKYTQYSADNIPETDISEFTDPEKKLYRQWILPRLQKANSPYKDLAI